MDFPRSVPSVGLVDGKFIDEDAVAGTPGSLIPSAWGNAVTLEILKVIQEAGLDPDEDDNTQLNAAIDHKITESSVAFASQPEAEAGESTTKVMSPLRVFQAIAKVVTQATESAFGWVKIASPQQIAAGTNDAAAVTPKKLATAVQAQAFTAFSTSGTATALTLTPSPAIDGYEANQSFRIKFSLASGVNPTLNVSGKGPKALKQYDSAGAKVAAVFAANQLSQAEYDGVDWILLDQLPLANLVAIQGSTKNLLGSTTGASSAVSYSMDEVVVKNASNVYVTLRSVSVSPTFASAGANGIDVGAANSQVASTVYHVYVIWNGATVAGLLSLSSSAPTLPGGYTYFARIGSVRTDATVNKYPLKMNQAKTRVQLSTPVTMITGIQGNSSTPAWIPVGVAAFVPGTASAIYCTLHGIGAGVGTIAAPNSNYGGYASVSNPPPLSVSAPPSASINMNSTTSMVLESGSIFYASGDSSGSLVCLGWEDNL